MKLTLPTRKETIASCLGQNEGKVVELLQKLTGSDEDKSLASEINKFSTAYFAKNYDPLSAEEKTTFLGFLTKGFQFEGKDFSKDRLHRLLILDGLVPIEQTTSDKYEAGSHLLAAFVSTSRQDYHFMRYFREGWFERKEDFLKQRSCKQIHKLVPITTNESMQQAFSSEENGNDLKNHELVGYYLVPPTVQLADMNGRNFVLEGHRIAYRQAGSSSASSVTSGSSGFRSPLQRQPFGSKALAQGGGKQEEEKGAAAAAAASSE